MQDGLKGTALGPSTAPVAGATSLTITSVSLNNLSGNVVPIGARFQIAGETNPIVHTVTSRTEGSGTGGASEVQTVAVTNATGGTFKLLWNGQESTEIGYDADAATVAAALAPLVGAVSNISVTGSLGSWTVTFAGTLANAPQPLLQTDVSELIGTNAYVAIAETTLGVVPTGTSGTTAITFSPALTAGTYAATPAITFQPQQVYIKIGDGNLTYTEHRDYQYLLDRGLLDTVREPKDVPMDVKLDAVYEHITSGTSDNVCPMERAEGAQQRGGMGQFGSRRLRAVLRGRAGGLQPALRPVNRETTVFPMFRAETREINYSAATIVFTGKCMAKEPTVYRGSEFALI